MNAPGGSQAPTPEPFVSADAAAAFLGVSRRFLLSLARRSIAGAYPIGTGLRQRNVWVFRLSELSKSIAGRQRAITDPKSSPNAVRSGSGSPR